MNNQTWPTDEEAEERDAEAWLDRLERLGTVVPKRLIRDIGIILPDSEESKW